MTQGGHLQIGCMSPSVNSERTLAQALQPGQAGPGSWPLELRYIPTTRASTQPARRSIVAMCQPPNDQDSNHNKGVKPDMKCGGESSRVGPPPKKDVRRHSEMQMHMATSNRTDLEQLSSHWQHSPRWCHIRMMQPQPEPAAAVCA